MQAPPPIPELLARLDRFASLAAAAARRPQLDWYARPAVGEWSLTELACHLRDVEREVHQPRFRAILTQDNPFLPGVSSNEWARRRRYQQESGAAALASFLAAREETVSMLSALDADAWRRQGSHAFFGPSTLHEMLHLAVKHDQAHRQQLLALAGISG